MLQNCRFFGDAVDAAISYYNLNKNRYGIYWGDLNLDDTCILIKERRESGAWVSVCRITFGGGFKVFINE